MSSSRRDPRFGIYSLGQSCLRPLTCPPSSPGNFPEYRAISPSAASIDARSFWMTTTAAAISACWVRAPCACRFPLRTDGQPRAPRPLPRTGKRVTGHAPIRSDLRHRIQPTSSTQRNAAGRSYQILSGRLGPLPAHRVSVYRAQPGACRDGRWSRSPSLTPGPMCTPIRLFARTHRCPPPPASSTSGIRGWCTPRHGQARSLGRRTFG